MDWDRAVERNRDAVLDIVSGLFALFSAASFVGKRGLMLPRRVWWGIWKVLRPAEAAVRRIILIAARGLTTPWKKPRVTLGRRTSGAGLGGAGYSRIPAFGLIDPLREFLPPSSDGSCRQIIAPPSAHPDKAIEAEQLYARLRALRHALVDINKQARRLARWKGRRDAMLRGDLALAAPRLSPMRPGLAPGWRSHQRLDIDPILRECHRLARDLVNLPDTSPDTS